MSRLALLDRDGTINVERDHLTSPDELELIPGAAEGIALLASLGLRIVVVSNQSVLGRGWLSDDGLRQVHERLAQLLAAEGAAVEAFFVCPHRPDEGCACRKPAPGLGLQAAARFDADLASSFVVGDTASDLEFGRCIGATAILVRTGHGTEQVKALAAPPPYVVEDLLAAARLIKTMVEA